MITHSDSIKTISKALLTFQGAVDGVEKNRSNPGFKSRYANLEAVRDTAVPELQKVGLVYAQSPGKIVDGVMSMTTMIIHAESGEWMKFEGDITLGKRDPQGTGSAMTYMQRYSLMAALGLPPVDDDGEAATDRSRPQQAQRRPETQQTAPAPSQATSRDYLAELAEATTESIQDLFAEAWRSTGDSQKKDKLKAAYERRKRELTQPSKAPDFENLQP